MRRIYKSFLVGISIVNGIVICSTRAEPAKVFPDVPSAVIGVKGGYVKLRNFIADIPAGALGQNTKFTLETFQGLPKPLPRKDEFLLAQVKGAKSFGGYKITANHPDFLSPIQVVIPMSKNIPNDFMIELYRWDGKEYMILQIVGVGTNGGASLGYNPIRLAARGDTFIVFAAPLANLIKLCKSRKGVFNGKYCELP
jgi:hypothetical protein